MDEPILQPKQTNRPQLLTILCILSFIGSGIGGFSYFMMYASYYEILPMLEEMSEQFPVVSMFLNTGRTFFLTGFILYFLSIFGVSLLWRMRKAGLHFYAGSQIMLLLMPLFYIETYPIPYFDGAITIFFIYAYTRFYQKFTS